MYAGYGAKQAENYLAQRINSASPEELAAMLLAGAERFLTQAAAAIRRKDFMEKARLVKRAADIIQALQDMINPEGEEEAVNRLHGIYIWWLKDIFEASMKDRPEQIEVVIAQMVNLRGGWEELSARAPAPQAPAAFSMEGLVG